MLDNTYIRHIKNSELLSESSKRVYIKHLEVIKERIFDRCKSDKIPASRENCIDYIIHNPEIFLEKLDEYIREEQVGIHTKLAYIRSIEAIFRHTPGMIQKESSMYKRWLELHRNMREPINTQYLSNEPTPRQKEAYVSYDELVRVRDELTLGSDDRLLLAIYTMIPPARNDYYNLRIYRNVSDINRDEDGNYMVLAGSGESYIILQKYKTAKIYKALKIMLPDNLIAEIEASLKKYPRNHLFVEKYKGVGGPYQNSGSFNKWANNQLKSLFDKKNITIGTLRHIYISHADLEGKSGLEKNKLARDMGHSIATQNKYNWFIYTDKLAAENKKLS